jgi:dTDP-4-amino-4,6-dideoxygalactose transaminase
MIRLCTSVKPDFSVVEKYLEDDFQTAQLSNFGPCYKRLADELAVYLSLPSDKKIVLTSSGHTALMAAYNQYGKDGYKYIYGPSYTFPSTWLAIPPSLEYKAYENVYSLSPFCLHDNVLSIVASLSIIPDFKAIENVFSLMSPIVIDGAATFGTKNIYWYGDYYCLSFHATKTFPLGEGGAVICPADKEEEIRQFINFGMDQNKYIPDNGVNGKMSEYTCAIGLSILPKMDEIIDKRLENAAIYKKRLKGFIERSWIEDTVYQVFPIHASSAREAEKIRQRLTSNNIQNLQYYKPHRQVWTKYAQNKYDRNICLPVHQNLTVKDIDSICDLVLSI